MKRHYEAKDFWDRLAILFYSTQYVLLWHSLAWTVSTLHTFIHFESQRQHSITAGVARELEGLPLFFSLFRAHGLRATVIKDKVWSRGWRLDNNWMTIKKRESVCCRKSISFLRSQLILCYIQIVVSIHHRKKKLILAVIYTVEVIMITKH